MRALRESRDALAGPSADLWLLDAAAAGELLASPAAAQTLAHDDIARNPRPLRAEARRARLAGRLLCRTALAELTGAAPADLRFQRGPFGRPELVPNPGGLRFSVAHTGGLAACLVTRGIDCGLDLERTPVSPDVLAMARRFLAPDELACLEASPAAERSARFAEYWVLREAYSKALGTGLTRPPDAFSFGWLPSLPVRVRDREADEGEDGRWRFELTRVGEGVLAAIALRAPDGAGPVTLRVRRPDGAAVLPVAA